MAPYEQHPEPPQALTEPPAPFPTPHGPLAQCDKNRVLIVDDESMVRMVFKQVISYGLPDCEVDLAENGQLGVDQFKANHAGVILLDLHMPVMTGDRAFVEIRNLCKEENIEMPAIIFCTGYDPPHEIRNLVAENPAHCVLRKPVSNDTLVEAIRLRLGQ